jgi:basic amino acid/polyamine antiporter, APA family
MSLFRKKSIDDILLRSSNSQNGLKRSLGPANLIAIGIGAIIGSGLFVSTAVAASEAAGPAVIISYIIGGLGCTFAGLCYAEFASMIPVSGSAYTYAYATMGEFPAWLIGWALILEYGLAGVTVSGAWSEYLNSLVNGMIPYQWCHSPWETSAAGVSGILNVPAIIILILVSLILIKGVQESTLVNAIIVFVKIAIVLLFIVIGWNFIDPTNYSPFTIPESTPGHESWNHHGWGGVLGGAGIVFFAFIGFDAVSTTAQESKNPKRDMPIGILGSLVVCTILFVLFAYVLTGVANWQEFKVAGKEASVVYAIKTHMEGYGWLATLVNVAILSGFTSVILVMLMGQSRVFFTMANDGLIPKIFADLHPKFRTPYKSNIILLLCTAPLAGLIPQNIVGQLTSFGTLFAFVLVCLGIWIMRKKNPGLTRPFKTPFVPFVPIMGILICSTMMLSLNYKTQLMALAWIFIGSVVYFAYGRKHSALEH